LSAPRQLARGDIVLISFPFTDLSTQKVRPALIVARITGDDLVAAFVTSSASPGVSPAVCTLDKTNSEFAQTGLRTASAVRLDKLATLQRRLVMRRLGRIGPQTTSAVQNALRYVFDL